MIESVPHRWQSIRATVSETVEVPTNASSVTILPAEEGSDVVTVSFFVSEFETDSEVEARPVRTRTIEGDDSLELMFMRHPTIVPSENEDSATLYFLGQTDEERRTLW